ncbi:MAG TPA: cation:proton antiporter, partial [Gaiellaceae bacterium]|nr:cation:proton antiporter [Gaiellaceae bacterium]
VDLPWAAAFTLGAIVSPTDPIAASAIAERLGVPRRISAVIEGESLVNDATALVAYRVAVGAVVGVVLALERRLRLRARHGRRDPDRAGGRVDRAPDQAAARRSRPSRSRSL